MGKKCHTVRMGRVRKLKTEEQKERIKEGEIVQGERGVKKQKKGER